MRRPRLALFDVNGTLTDVREIGAPWMRPQLGPLVLDQAARNAMVESLQGRVGRPFAEHLRAALEVAVADEGLAGDRIESAMDAAAALPAWADAAAALAQLSESGIALVALTNSGARAGTATLQGCGLIEYFDRVLGVDAVQAFKPHPEVYAYALRECRMQADDAVLVATHPWDLAGAAHAGLHTAWVRHGRRGWPEVFSVPRYSGDTLLETAELIIASNVGRGDRRGSVADAGPADVRGANSP